MRAKNMSVCNHLCAHEDSDCDHECDACHKPMGEHEAAEGSPDCEYCGKPVSECVDEDGDHNCDICGGEVAGADVPASGDPFALIMAALRASCAGLAALRKKKG